MIPVNGKPLIGHIVEYLETSGIIDEIIIVADFGGLGGQIKNYYSGAGRTDITYVQDSQSGTGGDLLHVGPRLRGESEFLLWFVDNLCAADIGAMIRQFKETGSLACIATRTKRREETGFAHVGEDGIIKQFKEKPIVHMPMAECLGIYILSSDIIKRIRAHARLHWKADGAEGRNRHGNNKRYSINLSYDILQPISGEGRVCAYDIGDRDWIDVGTPVMLDRNASVVKRITRQMAP